MSAVAFRSFVSGMPPFICGVLISLLVFAWTGPSSVSVARPPDGPSETRLGREIDKLSLELAKTEQELEQERRLVQHLKRELRDASLQIDVFSQLRRAAGQSSDPIWPGTAVASDDSASTIVPYVIGAGTLIATPRASGKQISNTRRRSSPYAARKGIKPRKPHRVRKVHGTKSTVVRPRARLVAVAPAKNREQQRAVNGAKRTATTGAQAPASTVVELAKPVAHRATQPGTAKTRKVRRARTRVVRLPKPARLGRLASRRRYSARRTSAVKRRTLRVFAVPGWVAL